MITLKELKKIMYNDITAPRNIAFLTTFLPANLYNNPNPKLNINLIDSEYKTIAGWLSYLMNGKTALHDKEKIIRSGVERVRNQMLSIVLKEQDTFNAIEANCKNFISQHPIDQNSLITLIRNDSEIEELIKEHLEKCVKVYLPHGLTLLFVCALLPNHIQTLTNLKYWENPNPLTCIRLNRSQYDIVLSLQKQLGSLINALRESCGLGEEIDNNCLNKLLEFDATLRIHALDIPHDIHQWFNHLLDSANSIYYQLDNPSDPSSTSATIFAYNLQKIIKLQQAYDSFCSRITEIIISEKKEL